MVFVVMRLLLNYNNLMAKTKENTKQVVTKENTNIPVKADTLQIAKSMIKDYRVAITDPKSMIDNVKIALDKFYEAKTEEERKTALEVVSTKVWDAKFIYGLDNHYPVAETVNKNLQPFVIEMSNNLIAEYDCKTPSEKMLAESVASSYGRYLMYTHNTVGAINIDFLSEVKTAYYTFLGKEADRAHRQFTMSLSLLKQLKAPATQINVKTKNAFIAQNQQLNNVREEQAERRQL